MAKFRNESSTSVSTLAVALGVDALEISAGRGVLAATALPVEMSLTASFLTSCTFGSPGVFAPAFSSADLASVLVFPCGLASDRAICEEMIAGSTGAPATVGLPLGGLRAGGIYLFDWLG